MDIRIIEAAEAELIDIAVEGRPIHIRGVLTPEQLALAVSSGDSKAFTKASGVGKKLAERITLELRDKVKKLGVTETPGEITAASAVLPQGNISKAVGALAVLGYSPEEVTPFMGGIDPSLSVEEIIGQTLRAIGKK